MVFKKDRVELICSVSELAGVFDKSQNLNDFLQTVVSVVAYHMRAAVCSIYLLDEGSQELVLRANQGLNPDSIEKVRLKIGEGLTGLAVKELRPIREARGPDNPFFKFIPGLGEEKYESFLAVPILRGFTRIGALVVQDTQRDYFDPNDTKALQAIATQLATTIENAKLIMNIHQGLAPAAQAEPRTEPRHESFYKGTSTAAGLAFGKAVVVGQRSSDFIVDDRMDSRLCTREDFQLALTKTEKQIEELQRRMEERLSDVASLIFSAHLLILKDPDFSGSMFQRIEEGIRPPHAVVEVVNRYIHLFSQSSNQRLQEKVQDVKDLGRRLLHNLAGRDSDGVDYKDRVVISGELLPSDILRLAAQQAAGLIMVGGTVSSHLSVLSRSMDIPTVLVTNRSIFSVPDGTPLMLDAEQGNVIVQPSAEVQKRYETLMKDRQRVEALEREVLPETRTRDGTRVTLLANINLLSELAIARRLKAEGVGLYRSEFPFIVRDNFPSEEEQYLIYRKILDEMGGREVTFRTLDMGGDKMLSYFPGATEANPFLGLRAIRFSLKHTGIFHRQIRALLRAGADRRLRIMFPLVSSVDEFVQARKEVQDCSWTLGEEGVTHNNRPELGVMIELPSAIEVVDELAQEADFLCIGGNDLVQHMLAVDRTNERISDLYLAHHPAVLRALKRVTAASARHFKPLSLCGDVAGDLRLLPFLLGIGLRAFSVAPRWIPKLQQRIMEIDLGEAEIKARAMLNMGRVSDINELLAREDPSG